MDLSGFCRFCLTEDDAKTVIIEDPDGLAEKINICLPNKVSRALCGYYEIPTTSCYFCTYIFLV